MMTAPKYCNMYYYYNHYYLRTYLLSQSRSIMTLKPVNETSGVVSVTMVRALVLGRFSQKN